MTSERRRYRRVKAKGVAGHLKVREEVMGLGLPIENISLGGLFVRCSRPLPAGTPLVLELVQPSMPRPLKVIGTAVLSLDPVQAMTAGTLPGMGVQFEPLPPEDLERLKALLNSLAADGKVTAVPAHSPAQVSGEVQASRGAFDFGFKTLEAQGDEEPPSFLAPPAPPKARARPGQAPSPPPQKGRLQAPVKVPAPLPAPGLGGPVQVEESAKLMVQVRGLLQDLDETRLQLGRRAEENARLRRENERLAQELRAKEARLAELESSLPGERG